eukprot:6326248-Pyramimonas_sp.AAC.1
MQSKLAVDVPSYYYRASCSQSVTLSLHPLRNFFCNSFVLPEMGGSEVHTEEAEVYCTRPKPDAPDSALNLPGWDVGFSQGCSVDAMMY